MSVGLDRQIQGDFRAGMFRGVAPELIPQNGAYDIVNGLLTEDGAIFRRGGTTYRSTSAMASAITAMWDGTLTTGGQQTIIARNGSFSSMDSVGNLTNLGGTGLANPGRPVAYQGVLYLPGGATFNGGSLGTAAKVAPYYTVVANRLLALNGTRLDFSDVKTPGTFNATNYHEFPDPGIGIVGLRDSAMVFTTDGVWIVSNMALNLTDAAGNVQHRLDRYSREIILWGDAGIAPWAGGVIVPGTDAVWQINLGIASEAPQAFGRISDPIQALYREYVRDGFTPGQATVYANHYILPILSGATVVDTLVCRLDVQERPWSRLAGMGGKAPVVLRRISPATRRPELLLGHSNGYVSNGWWFEPSSAAELDADGTPFQWSVTTRDFQTGRYVPNTVIKLRASYQLQDVLNANPTMQAFYLPSRVVNTGSRWGRMVWGTNTWSSGGEEAVALEQLSGDAPTDAGGVQPFTWFVRRKARFVRFRLRSDSSTDWLSLRALEMFVRESGRI